MNRRIAILAALLLALRPLGARAAVERAAPLYSAPSAKWGGVIGDALSLAAGAFPLSPALIPLTLPSLSPAVGFAPVVIQLESQFQLTPAAFAALPVEDRRVVLELALEAAQGDLTQKAAELMGRARALASPDKALDNESRAQLYRVAVRLDEMRTRYGPLLQPRALEAVTEFYGRAFARVGLTGAGRDQPAAAVSAAAGPAFIPAPAGKAARDLAAAMRNNAVGWKLRDLDRLLIGYGFTLIQGGKHRKYEFPGMKPEIVPRHTEVDRNYIRSALAAISRIESFRAAVPAADARAAVPPADLARLQPATPRAQAQPKEPPPASEPEQPNALLQLLERLENAFTPRG